MSGLATAPIGDSSTVHVGDSVTALGNAEGRGGSPAVANGSGDRARAVHHRVGPDRAGCGESDRDDPDQRSNPARLLRRSAGQRQRPGDRHGHRSERWAEEASEQGSIQAFAIPIDTALNYAHQLIAHPTAPPAPALLGVCVGPSTSPQGAVLVAGAPCGANGVESGTPAATTALGAGDVITSVGGAAVLSNSSLRAILEGDHPGQSVVIVWTDPNGQQHRATVTLAAAQQ